MRAFLLLLAVAAALPPTASARPRGRAPQQAPEDGPSRGAGFAIAAPVTIEALVHEDTPYPELQGLAAVPGATVRIAAAGMLRRDVVAVLRRLPGAAMRITPPLEQAHVEQLQSLAGLPVEIDLGGARPDGATLRRIDQLGPRPLAVSIDASATGFGDPELALAAALPPARLRVQFGARGPGPSEAAALASLRRLRPEVVLDAGARPEAVRAAIGAGLAVRVIARDDRVPPQLLAELARARSEVAVELSGLAALSDVARLGGLPSLQALTFRFDRRPILPRDAGERLAAVRPPPL